MFLVDALPLLLQPRRAALLRAVWQSERAAGDLAEESGVTFGAVSQHLKKLLDAGAVSVRRDGRNRYYRANRDALGPIAPLLEAMWTARLTDLKSLAEAEQSQLDRGPAAKPKARPHRSAKEHQG